MANDRVHVSLAFTADTKQAKRQIDELQNTLSKLATFDHFEVGDVITEDLLKASNAVTKLQSQLKQAFNQDTGRIDLSKFKQQLDASGMSIDKYRDELIKLGPEGEQAFLGVARAIQNAEIPLKRSGKLANDLWITLKNTARWQISASIIQGFQGALQKAYGYAQDLNESLNNIRIVTNYSVNDMAKFAVEANKAAKALSTTTTEYTNASLIYYQQGLSAEEVKERTDVTIKMANVSRESAETVSDQMTAVWNNFADGSRTLEYYADVMTALGAATASSTAEITTGLEKFAAVAETVGLSYEYATTALATITDTTRQSADIVGNALKTLFARIQGLSLGETLEDGTDLTKYSEALAKVGISIKEQDGSLREMDDILDDMAERWETLAKDQQVALAQTVAGVRQYTQLVALMDNWDKFQKNLSVANNASGSLQEQADIYAESWEASRERVQAALESIFNDLVSDEFFIDLNNTLAKTIGLLDQMIDNFGGLEGVIAGLGIVLTKVFNKQITQSISNLGFNLKQRWTGGSEEEALKASAANSVYNWYNANQTNVNSLAFGVSDTTVDNYGRIAELQIKLNQNSAAQTEEQREINAQLIQRLENMNKLTAAAEHEARVQEESVNREYNELLNNPNKNTKKTNAQAKNSITRFKNQTGKLGALTAYSDALSQGKTIDELKELQLQLQKTYKIDLSQMTADDAAALLRKEIEKTSNNVEKLTQEMKEMFGLTDTEAKELVQRFQQVGSAKVKALSSQQDTEGALNDQFGDLDMEGLSQGFTNLVSGISEVAFGLQSLSTITDTLNNQDLTWGEKTLSIIQSVAFGLPSLINGLGNITNGLTSLGTGLSKLGPAIAAGKVSWLSYKTTTDAAGVSSKKLMISILGLKMSMGAFLLTIGFVAVAIGGLVAAWNAWQARQPEALLEKAKEESEGLKKALTEAKAASEDLKASIEGYDSAVKKLKDCIAGTEEWRDALQDANSKALELLEKYPELYKMNAVGKNGDLITIDDKALEKVQQQYKNREYALQGAQVISQQKINDLNAQVNNEKIREKAVQNGFTDYSMLQQAADENWDQKKLTEKLMEQGFVASQYENRRMAKEMGESDTWNKEFDYDVAYDLVNEIKELNTEIADNSEATKFAGEVYAETVLADNKDIQNSDNKNYIEKIIGSEVADIQESVKESMGLTTDQAIFNKYKEEYGLDSDAKLNSNGQVMLNGQEITNVAAMTAALTAEEMNAKIDARAAELAKTFASGNQAEIGKAIYNATGDLGNLSHVQIEALNGDESISQALQDSITQYLTDASIVAPGLENLSINLAAGLSNLFDGDTSAISNIFTSLGKDADDVANIINQINWHDWDADEGFAAALKTAGLEGKLTEQQFELLTSALKDSNNAVKAFDSDNWSQNIKETSETLEKIDVGSIIEEEDLARFKQIDAGFGEYFTKMADGTYMLTKDAEEFYALVRDAQLNEVKEAISSNENEITRLRSEAEKAANDGKDDLADSYNAEADKLAKENSILQSQGLSMARSGEEFDEMANEDEFKTLDKTSESYQRLRNEIIKTEEERGKEVETLEELNKLRNKGEIGNRGYAAGLTKLAKQYPQLNKEVVKYEEAMADYGKDSKEAASALNDLNNAMSAAQWKTAAQDLYDARAEIRELKAEYGSLATEMEEYQTALQDQADALTALFGVEVSPAFAEAHADLIDEYLAGSQAAGYELMWLAEQQSGHIDTIVNQYLASTGASAEQIISIVNALNGLEFNIDGSADFTQVIAACAAAEVPLIELAKMLNALGSSHLQFDVTTNQDQMREAIDKANSLFEGSNKKEDILGGKSYEQWVSYYSKAASMSVTASGSVPAVDEFKLSTVSGKNKGGGSKGTKKVASDEKERFHVITKQIDSATAALEDYEKNREKAFGPLKNTYMDEEIAKTKNLISLQEQYIAEIKDYLASDEPEIKKYGAIIDADSGVITNYDEMMDKQIAIYNEAIEKAGTNEKAQEAAEKAYDLFIKALENYENTYAIYLDELAKLQDLQNEKIDKELEHIQDRLDAKLELEADQLTYLDYLIGKLDDEAFALADALVSLHDKTQPIMNQSDHYAEAWEELQQTAEENGGWTQDMIDKLRELRDGLISTNEEMMELQKTIEEKVNEAIAECTDELDKQINRFDTYQNILQNYNDIIDLSGKKFKDYAMMLELSSLMTDNAINKLASSREKLETLGEAQINAQAKLELAEDSGDQDVIDYWKKTLEDIQIEVENATADMTSAWKEALQSASDAFESQVNLAIDNFKGGLKAFGDLDMISDSYDRAEKAAERYLEDFEKTYELSQLGRDITKAMNDATSAFAKDELAELMAEVNEKQKDSVKMSEYDLEVLKKKFELKQAELALEEAQNSMSQVRLTRDNEGNWSYQYTADQDKVDEALNEYETRLYEVAKLSDEYIDEMSKAIIDNQKDMYEALAGLRAEDFESYTEYETAVRDIVDFYTSQDTYLRAELVKAVGDTEYITTAMSGHYNNLSTSFTTVVDTMLGNTGDKTGNLKTWMESTDNLAKQAKKEFETELPKAYATWEKAVGDAMEAAGTNTEDFKDDVSGYMEDIGDASDILADDIEDATDDMQDYIENVMDAVWDWQEEYAAAIREMIAANEALIQSMMQVAAAQGAGGGNEPSDYSRAIAELLEGGASINDPQILEWLEKRAKKDAEGKYLSNDRLMKLFTAYDNGDEKAIEAVKGVLYHNKWFTDEYLKPFGFNTGGYTGVWGPEGKMALVHEKELILNPSDTVNFLAGVNILREIAKMIDLQAANMAMPMSFAMPSSTSSGRQIDQNVHIQASFPGVQDRNEIEIALRSLVNEASQFVLE